MNETVELIQKTLDKIRPFIQRDGGDVEYVDFEVHDFFDFRGRNFYERRFQKVVEITAVVKSCKLVCIGLSFI